MKSKINKLIQIFVLILYIILISCESPERLPNPFNPYDPGSPDYEAPKSIITGGAFDGDTINTSTVTFTWVGNEITGDFSYRLNDSNWSGWSQDTSVTYDYLNEESYQFDVRARSDNVAKLVGDTTSVTFTADAVEGSSLMFYPRYKTLSVGSTEIVEIRAEEVVDIMGAEIGISFDPSKIEIDSVSSGNFMQKNGGELIFFKEIDNPTGMINIVSVTAGRTIPTVSGTGVIATLFIKGISTGIAQLEFTDICIYRDENDDAIEMKEKTIGVLNIE